MFCFWLVQLSTALGRRRKDKKPLIQQCRPQLWRQSKSAGRGDVNRRHLRRRPPPASRRDKLHATALVLKAPHPQCILTGWAPYQHTSSL